MFYFFCCENHLNITKNFQSTRKILSDNSSVLNKKHRLYFLLLRFLVFLRCSFLGGCSLYHRDYFIQRLIYNIR